MDCYHYAVQGGTQVQCPVCGEEWLESKGEDKKTHYWNYQCTCCGYILQFIAELFYEVL